MEDEDSVEYNRSRGKSTVAQSTDSTKSVNDSSHNSSTIRLYVGTAPLGYNTCERKNVGNPQDSNDDDNKYRTVLIEQECGYFCSVQKCYQTPWKPVHVYSDLLVA